MRPPLGTMALISRQICACCGSLLRILAYHLAIGPSMAIPLYGLPLYGLGAFPTGCCVFTSLTVMVLLLLILCLFVLTRLELGGNRPDPIRAPCESSRVQVRYNCRDPRQFGLHH